MNPHLVNVSAFRVSGIRVRTTSQSESSPETAKLPSLWGRFYSEGVSDKVANQVQGSAVYGVYSTYESDLNGPYDVTAGKQIDPSQTGGADFVDIDIPADEYLVFEGKGELPGIVISTWQAIWSYFSSAREFKRKYSCDFEAYTDEDQVAINISVTKV
jgi:predicted transcriptional regulator YdeE